MSERTITAISKSDDYIWHEDWIKIPHSDVKPLNGRTHGIVYTIDNTILLFHQSHNGLLTYSTNGELLSAVGGDRWLGAHGLTTYRDGLEEYYWLTDEFKGYVDKVDKNGNIIESLDPPTHSVYTGSDAKEFKPTWAAQNPVNGDIWVTDGYGGDLVIRYSREGRQLDILDGTEGLGRFKTPHGLEIRLKKDNKHELFITDRASKQLVVYDMEGRFLRHAKGLHSPCSFSFYGKQVVIPELFSGIKVLDADTLDLQTEIGKSDRVIPRDLSSDTWWLESCPDDYPDLRDTEDLVPGMFSSPHGCCVSPKGDIYVVEWIIGGRVTKLERR